MEDIRTVEDLIQFILQADEIERDGGAGRILLFLYMIYHLKNFWILQKMQSLLNQKKG